MSFSTFTKYGTFLTEAEFGANTSLSSGRGQGFLYGITKPFRPALGASSDFIPKQGYGGLTKQKIYKKQPYSYKGGNILPGLFFEGNGLHLPKIKSSNTNNTKMARKYKGKKRTTKRRGKKRIPRSVCEMRPPNSKLVKLHSYHTLRIDPAANDAIAYERINLNNPLDPFSAGTGVTIATGERKPQYWDHYSSIYDYYEPISTKVSAHFMQAGTNNHTVALFLVPSSVEAQTETIAQISTVDTFAQNLLTSNRRAKVWIGSSTAEQSSGISLVGSWNHKKIEGIKKNSSESALFKAVTGASGTEVAPTRLPVAYIGGGSIDNQNVDVQAFTVMVKLEYVILFTGATQDIQQANL